MVTWSCYYTVWTDCIHSRFLRWTPTPNVSGQCLEMRLLDIIRFWWVHKVGSPSRISVFTSRGKDTGAAPSTCCPPSPSRDQAAGKSGENSYQAPSQPAPWPWASYPQEMCENNFFFEATQSIIFFLSVCTKIYRYLFFLLLCLSVKRNKNRKK